MVSARRSLIVSLLVLSLIPALAAAQAAPGLGRPDVSPLWRGVGSFVFTLLAGGLVLAIAPGFVDRVVERVATETGVSFVWGLLLLVLFIGSFVLLAMTGIGLVIAIPLLIAFVVFAVIGNALAYLALLDGVVGDRKTALLVGAAVAGLVAAIPVLGDLVGFVVGSIGVGAIALNYRS